MPIALPVTAEGNSHVFHVFGILSSRRDALHKFLSEREISTIIYYPHPLHLQKVWQDLGHRLGDFPVAEKISETILPLPIYPELSDEQVAKLKVGDLLNDDAQNPLIYSKNQIPAL